jgi:hypothetical protein
VNVCAYMPQGLRNKIGTIKSRFSATRINIDDLLAEDAVTSELFSGSIFAANREKYREYSALGDLVREQVYPRQCFDERNSFFEANRNRERSGNEQGAKFSVTRLRYDLPTNPTSSRFVSARFGLLPLLRRA